MIDQHDAHVTDRAIYRELVRIASRPRITHDDNPNPITGPGILCRLTTETDMTAPILPPRPRRSVSVYLTDDVLDRLDMLVAILPDAPNRSRLIASFVEMQLALLLNPAEGFPMVLEGVLNTITAEGMAEIEAWKVPETV